MASSRARIPHNAPGAFYVDASCIDCSKCQQVAPAHFARRDGRSHVVVQPVSEAEQAACLNAIAACPVSAIGDDGLTPLPITVRRLLPDLWSLSPASPLTDGAAAYLLVRAAGNVMVDVPAYDRALLTAVEDLGGIATIIVTHEDNLGEIELFQAHFGCEVVMHAAEAEAAPWGVDRPFDAPLSLDRDLLVVPTPGHTPGSSCVLWRRNGGCLFTGDHLLPTSEGLAPVRFDWTHDWATQLAAVTTLLALPWQHAFPARELEWLPLGYARGAKAQLKARMLPALA